MGKPATSVSAGEAELDNAAVTAYEVKGTVSGLTDTVAAKMRSEAEILRLKLDAFAHLTANATNQTESNLGVHDSMHSEVSRTDIASKSPTYLPQEHENAINSLFDSARDVATLLHEHAARETIVLFLNSLDKALARDVFLSALPQSAASVSAAAGCYVWHGEKTRWATAIRCRVNLRLAELHFRFENYEPAKNLFGGIVQSELHKPTVSSTIADTDAYAAIMYV